MSLKELKSLSPWEWDARSTKHPPKRAALQDFEKINSAWRHDDTATQTPGAVPTPRERRRSIGLSANLMDVAWETPNAGGFARKAASADRARSLLKRKAAELRTPESQQQVTAQQRLVHASLRDAVLNPAAKAGPEHATAAALCAAESHDQEDPFPPPLIHDNASEDRSGHASDVGHGCLRECPSGVAGAGITTDAGHASSRTPAPSPLLSAMLPPKWTPAALRAALGRPEPSPGCSGVPPVARLNGVTPGKGGGEAVSDPRAAGQMRQWGGMPPAAAAAAAVQLPVAPRDEEQATQQAAPSSALGDAAAQPACPRELKPTQNPQGVYRLSPGADVMVATRSGASAAAAPGNRATVQDGAAGGASAKEVTGSDHSRSQEGRAVPAAGLTSAASAEAAAAAAQTPGATPPVRQLMTIRPCDPMARWHDAELTASALTRTRGSGNQCTPLGCGTAGRQWPSPAPKHLATACCTAQQLLQLEPDPSTTPMQPQLYDPSSLDQKEQHQHLEQAAKGSCPGHERGAATLAGTGNGGAPDTAAGAVPRPSLLKLTPTTHKRFVLHGTIVEGISSAQPRSRNCSAASPSGAAQPSRLNPAVRLYGGYAQEDGQDYDPAAGLTDKKNVVAPPQPDAAARALTVGAVDVQLTPTAPREPAGGDAWRPGDAAGLGALRGAQSTVERLRSPLAVRQVAPACRTRSSDAADSTAKKTAWSVGRGVYSRAATEGTQGAAANQPLPSNPPAVGASAAATGGASAPCVDTAAATLRSCVISRAAAAEGCVVPCTHSADRDGTEPGPCMPAGIVVAAASTATVTEGPLQPDVKAKVPAGCNTTGAAAPLSPSRGALPPPSRLHSPRQPRASDTAQITGEDQGAEDARAAKRRAVEAAGVKGAVAVVPVSTAAQPPRAAAASPRRPRPQLEQTAQLSVPSAAAGTLQPVCQSAGAAAVTPAVTLAASLSAEADGDGTADGLAASATTALPTVTLTQQQQIVLGQLLGFFRATGCRHPLAMSAAELVAAISSFCQSVGIPARPANIQTLASWLGTLVELEKPVVAYAQAQARARAQQPAGGQSASEAADSGAQAQHEERQGQRHASPPPAPELQQLERRGPFMAGRPEGLQPVMAAAPGQTKQNVNAAAGPAAGMPASRGQPSGVAPRALPDGSEEGGPSSQAARKPHGEPCEPQAPACELLHWPRTTRPLQQQQPGYEGPGLLPESTVAAASDRRRSSSTGAESRQPLLPIIPLDLGGAAGPTPLESLASEWSSQLSPAVTALYNCLASCQEAVRNVLLSTPASGSSQTHVSVQHGAQRRPSAGSTSGLAAASTLAKGSVPLAAAVAAPAADEGSRNRSCAQHPAYHATHSQVILAHQLQQVLSQQHHQQQQQEQHPSRSQQVQGLASSAVAGMGCREEDMAAVHYSSAVHASSAWPTHAPNAVGTAISSGSSGSKEPLDTLDWPHDGAWPRACSGGTDGAYGAQPSGPGWGAFIAARGVPAAPAPSQTAADHGGGPTAHGGAHRPVPSRRPEAPLVALAAAANLEERDSCGGGKDPVPSQRAGQTESAPAVAFAAGQHKPMSTRQKQYQAGVLGPGQGQGVAGACPGAATVAHRVLSQGRFTISSDAAPTAFRLPNAQSHSSLSGGSGAARGLRTAAAALQAYPYRSYDIPTAARALELPPQAPCTMTSMTPVPYPPAHETSTADDASMLQPSPSQPPASFTHAALYRNALRPYGYPSAGSAVNGWHYTASYSWCAPHGKARRSAAAAEAVGPFAYPYEAHTAAAPYARPGGVASSSAAANCARATGPAQAARSQCSTGVEVQHQQPPAGMHTIGNRRVRPLAVAWNMPGYTPVSGPVYGPGAGGGYAAVPGWDGNWA